MKKFFLILVGLIVLVMPAKATTTLYLKQPLNSNVNLNQLYNYTNTTRSVLPPTTSITNTTASGSNIQWTATGGGTAIKWISPPLSAGVTISGTVTMNTWGLVSSSGAHTTFAFTVKKYTSGAESTALLTNSAYGSALTTSNANQNWTASPTSVTFAAGDRIVLIGLITNSGGTMAGSDTATLNYGGLTGSASGDVYVKFTENVSFRTEIELIQAKCQSQGGGDTDSQSVTFNGINTTGNTLIAWDNWGGAGLGDPTSAISDNAVPGITLDDHNTTLALSTTTVSTTITALAGDLITVQFSAFITSSSLGSFTVSDGLNVGNYSVGNTVYADTTSNPPNIGYIGTFYFQNSTSGSLTITANWIGTAAAGVISAQSWTGAAISSALDSGMVQQQNAPTATVNPNSGSNQTPAGSGELVMGYSSTVATIPTAGSSYTVIDAIPFSSIIPEYWIQTTGTATNAPYVDATPDTWTSQMIAFKPLNTPNTYIIPTNLIGTANWADNVYFDQGQYSSSIIGGSALTLTGTCYPTAFPSCYAEGLTICAEEFAGLGNYDKSSQNYTPSILNAGPITSNSITPTDQYTLVWGFIDAISVGNPFSTVPAAQVQRGTEAVSSYSNAFIYDYVIDSSSPSAITATIPTSLYWMSMVADFEGSYQASLSIGNQIGAFLPGP